MEEASITRKYIGCIVCFIDYSKAFDCRGLEKWWEALTNIQHARTSGTFNQKSLYRPRSNSKNGKTKYRHFWHRKKSITQGCTQSSLLFYSYEEYTQLEQKN